ncbi:pentapeptide repeat-containing protein, partial [Nostoc sp. UCD121]|uniref:pentapeptide repeat-containing protein n=1 Tax=Nostoc sp. UCD121 TaxID=2681305 RepID=UPI0021AB2C6D
FTSIVYKGYILAQQAWGKNYSQNVTTLVPISLGLAVLGTLVLIASVVFIVITNHFLFITIVIFGILTLIVSFLVALAMAGASSIACPLATLVTLTGSVAMAGAIARFLISVNIWDSSKAFILIIISSVIIGFLASYMGFKALSESHEFSWIKMIAVSFANLGSTSFRKANLTNADFSHATLNNTDFREVKVVFTQWFEVKKLGSARVETTYLKYPEVQRTLITRKGTEQNFDRLNLRGINFQRVILADASFIGTDLSEANLQDADLSRAKLKQTQLDGTDFTGATLTGAYVEDWGITTDTNFDGVKCEYVYMRLPTKENPDPHRKPDNRQEVFALGEFGDFIKPIFDTLDLYHSQGVDPRAIAISFKQLAENHPDAELEIVAMEKRGQDKFLLRAKTAATADKSELSAEYFTTYNQLKTLAEQEVQKLIAEKDKRITDLQNMVMTALQRPSFYAQTYQNQGDTIMSEGSKKQSNFDLKGAQFAGGLVNADTVTAQQIGGNITNYNPEQKQNLAQAAADIQQLLNQLGQSYPTSTPLEKQIAVTEALKKIDSNPTLKARVIGALKSGGTEALKELVDHPLVNILLATLEGWQDAE